MPGWITRGVQKVLAMTHGRTTAFFIAFFVSGNIFMATGKLSTVYIAFMGTLGGLVLAHSIKEDITAAVSGAPLPAGPDPVPEPVPVPIPRGPNVPSS